MANFILLCLKILIINIIVNNTANHLYYRFIRYSYANSLINVTTNDIIAQLVS